MDSLSLVIFGITGNLAQIKLIPALYDMEEKDMLPQNTEIIGIARKDLSADDFESYINEVLHRENKHHQHEINEDVFKRLLNKMKYLKGDLDDDSLYQGLKNNLDSNINRIFYLATYPDLYHIIFKNLKKYQLDDESNSWVRVMIEKPIGNDLESARDLNKLLSEFFKESQIYRLDHYLGKETLQDILTFRFANGLFENLMNKDFVDHIQITASEDYGIGDRGGYFDKVGMLKDVGQNHELQMIAFAAMDAPKDLSNEAVTKERLKILEALKPLEVVFGQYKGYQSEKNIEPNSKTDTFYAFKAQIENPRWSGIPIYVRAGKKLAKTITEIAVVFKTPENRLIEDLKAGELPNVLIFRIYPNEGIILNFLSKKPGSKVALEESYMQFCYKYKGAHLPDAYEQLIADTIRGDQTFFNDAKEVEAQWKFTDPLSEKKTSLTVYEEGSWGPKEADDLIEKDGRKWLMPSMEYCAF